MERLIQYEIGGSKKGEYRGGELLPSLGQGSCPIQLVFHVSTITTAEQTQARCCATGGSRTPTATLVATTGWTKHLSHGGRVRACGVHFTQGQWARGAGRVCGMGRKLWSHVPPRLLPRTAEAYGTSAEFLGSLTCSAPGVAMCCPECLALLGMPCALPVGGMPCTGCVVMITPSAA